MDFLELQELYHHGIKGQKWGIRRYQNEDGTLTEEGKKRYKEDAQKLTDMSTVVAELEDLTRQYDLRNARNNNTEVLVTKEDKKLWQDAYKLFSDLEKKYAKYKISTKIKTLDDGTDYVVSSVYDKKLGGVVEYYEPLLYDSNGKKYDEKNRLYNLTKSNNQKVEHSDELEHHGIKGQKWGIRRYQNDDGTLTAEGKKRYGIDSDGKMSKQGKKNFEYDQSRIRGYSLEKEGYTEFGQTAKARNVIEIGTLSAMGLYGLGKIAFDNINKKGYATKGELIKIRLLEAGIGAVAIGTIIDASKKIKRAKDISNYNENNEPRKMVQIK